MAKFRSIRNSFLGGQISPTAMGRTDDPKYAHSCELLRNMIPMLVGGAYQRPGTINVTALSAATDHPPRLFPFVDSINQSYVLAIGRTVGSTAYVKPYRPATDAGVAVGGTTLGTCSGTPPYAVQTNTSAITNFGLGMGNASADDEIFSAQFCQSADIMYLTHPNHKPQLITRTAKDTLRLRTSIMV